MEPRVDGRARMTEEQRVDQLIDCLRHRPVATTAAQMREAADLIESFRKRFDKRDIGPCMRCLRGAMAWRARKRQEPVRDELLKTPPRGSRVAGERSARSLYCQYMNRATVPESADGHQTPARFLVCPTGGFRKRAQLTGLERRSYGL
jgi:hypothetical protein